ncbi:MAG: hypothetical protein CVU46_09590 [Chloroflexi bacterium HGW-Chloroflexi-8]|nr:MAG: hypothetical protein CVU46_09590 [Chloroflexi bacterium HGW-Chloroflexi-8]
MPFAENSPYWDTPAATGKTQGEIMGLLENFGAESIMFAQGSSEGKTAWMVRFHWLGKSYRFLFSPLPIQFPEKTYTVSGKKVSARERSLKQMGRIALYFVKAILTAAEMNQDALFGFLELPQATTKSGVPVTTAELDISGLIKTLPEYVPSRLLTDRGDAYDAR